MGGGGVSGGQKSAAAGNLAGIGTTATGNMGLQGASTAIGNQVTPFYASRMTGGLPFYRNLTDYAGGNVAQAFAPQRAAILRSTSQQSNQPSGYRDALLANLGAQQARAFDSTLTQAQMANEAAKQQGAAGMTGEQQIYGGQALGYGGLGAQANQAILQAPQAPSIWGTLGGAAIGGAATF